MRRIRFKGPETDKSLVFLTNNMLLPSLTIAALYKSCWRVGLFFKYFKIKHNFGGVAAIAAPRQ